jgi:ABC-type lipoprotein release transport system permease subunit
MSKEKKVAGNAKRAAYAAKQEKEGNKVIGWIIGVLIGLGVVFAIFSCFMMS